MMSVNQLTMHRRGPIGIGGVEAERDGSISAGHPMVEDPESALDRCCGEPIRFFWADDGRQVGFCRQCGGKFINKSELRDSQSPWIGVDLDGTLAKEEESLEPDQIGAPVEAMAKRVKEWVEEGKTVKIFTARAASPRQVVNVRAWLKRNGLPDLEITNIKDYRMIQLWDDRCVRVATNVGEPMATPGSTSIPGSKPKAPGVRVTAKRNKSPGVFFSTLRYLFAL
jgi:hypothetical protein